MENKNEVEKIENSSANNDQDRIDVDNASAFVPRGHNQTDAVDENQTINTPKDAVVALNENMKINNLNNVGENLLLLFYYACTRCLRSKQTNIEPEAVSLDCPTTFNVANKHRKLSIPEYVLCAIFILSFVWALFNLILTTMLFFYDFEDKLQKMIVFYLVDFVYLVFSLVCLGYWLTRYRVNDKKSRWAFFSFFLVCEFCAVGLSFLGGVNLFGAFRILLNKNPD